MNLHEYARYDATDLAELIRSGEVSAQEVETAARSAIATVNPKLNGIVGSLFEKTLAADASGALAGIPFLIKDFVLHAAGVPVECGCRMLKGTTLAYDSVLMGRFRRAGLATLGRTNTPEFGWNTSTEPIANGATRNPWRLDRTPGGSSGGAAALVAAGAVPVAHGNDGGGSIRIPAACCGVVGLKPTRGRVPLGPLADAPLGGMTAEFAITRSVRDSALLLDAVHGYAPGDFLIAPPPARPYCQELKIAPGALRVAVSTKPHFDVPVDPEVIQATQTVAKQLETLGCIVVEDAPTFDCDQFFTFHLVQWSSFVAGFLVDMAVRKQCTPGPDIVEYTILACADYGKRLTAIDLHHAESARAIINRNVTNWMQNYDLHLLPTCATPAWALGYNNANDPSFDAITWTKRVFEKAPFTALFNLTGQPAITLPLAQSHDGLPIGVQLVGRFGDEATLFRVAAQLEQAMPWAMRRPAIHVAN